MEFDRTRQDVERIMEFAKLDKSDLANDIQCIQFDEDLDDDQFRLMEIDSTILASLQAGDSVTIRGLNTDSAVLCTRDVTYEIKGAETSNSMLLLPQLLIGEELTNDRADPVLQQVCALKHTYYELKPMRPSLGRLRAKLEEYPYMGPVQEQEQDSPTGLTYEELLGEIQASKAELSEMLKKLNACEIDGSWRILDFDYMINILFAIVAAANENSWSLNRLPSRQICFSLQDIYPQEVVRHVLYCFSSVTSQTSECDTETCVQLNEDLTCRACAELVLRSSVEFNLVDFEETWKATVPEGLVTNHDQLKGLALIRYDIKPEVVQYFCVSSLPEDIEERFRIIFRKREKWSLEEVSPYFEDLCTEKITVASLLTKYCRVSTQKGVRLYSSRK